MRSEEEELGRLVEAEVLELGRLVEVLASGREVEVGLEVLDVGRLEVVGLVAALLEVGLEVLLLTEGLELVPSVLTEAPEDDMPYRVLPKVDEVELIEPGVLPLRTEATYWLKSF